MSVFHDVAEMLEKVAEHLETHDAQQEQLKKAASERKFAEFAAAYEEATGEPMSAETREKLSATDETVLDLLLKKAQTAGGSPDSLGGPVSTVEPDTKVASSKDADDRFLSFIMS